MAWRIFPALHHFYLENQEHVRHTLSYLVFSFIQGLVKWKRSVVIYHRLLHFLVLTMFFLWNSCIYFLVFHPCDYVLYTVLLLPVGGFVCWIMVHCVFSSIFFLLMYSKFFLFVQDNAVTPLASKHGAKYVLCEHC
jgi:hypothetical protein